MKATPEQLAAAYRLIADLLLHPEQRHHRTAREYAGGLRNLPVAVGQPMAAFLDDPTAWNAELYVHTLELTPPCPLYLGTYLFDEPRTCRDIGLSGRNGYMLELSGVYRHFGLEIDGRELPDYLPLMVEFLAVALERPARDEIGLRRRFLEQYLLPGLRPLHAALGTHAPAYARLAEALEVTATADLETMGHTPAWTPAARTPVDRTRVLPVLNAAAGPSTRGE